MTLKEKLEMLEEIMDVDEGTLDEETVLAEVDEWDSLSALTLTVEMKKRYGLNLTTDVLRGFRLVWDICRYIPD